jgi:hypothetical protein
MGKAIVEQHLLRCIEGATGRDDSADDTTASAGARLPGLS